MAADPLRWRLMLELAASDRRVNELTEAVGKPQNLVSYHLGRLRDAGLVRTRRSSADGRDIYYSADLGHCAEVLADAGAALHPGLRLALVPSPRIPRQGRRVLFLCTGNSARSQIAEALLEQMAGGAVTARSAGSFPRTLHPNAVRVMAARGVDIADRPPKHLSRFTRSRFDAVVTLCDRVREVCPEFRAHPRLVHWSIPDPALEGRTDDESYPAFERTASELEVRVRFLLASLTQPQPERTTSHER